MPTPLDASFKTHIGERITNRLGLALRFGEIQLEKMESVIDMILSNIDGTTSKEDFDASLIKFAQGWPFLNDLLLEEHILESVPSQNPPVKSADTIQSSTDDFSGSMAEILLLGNAQNWQESLEEVKRSIAVERIQDKELTQEDKDSICTTLLQRMVKAVKSGDLLETEISTVASYISSHMEQITQEASVKDFLRLLSARWSCFEKLPSLVYESPVSGHEEIQKLAQGVQ